MTTIKERLELLDYLHKVERDIMERKAHDYSGDADCNKNIKACERLGIVSAERGVLVRLMDKFQRINQLLDNEAQVKDESIFDTLVDLRNYAAILYDLILEKRPNSGQRPSSASPSVGAVSSSSGAAHD
jgi:hypothetical protein